MKIQKFPYDDCIFCGRKLICDDRFHSITKSTTNCRLFCRLFCRDLIDGHYLALYFDHNKNLYEVNFHSGKNGLNFNNINKTCYLTNQDEMIMEVINDICVEYKHDKEYLLSKLNMIKTFL